MALFLRGLVIATVCLAAAMLITAIGYFAFDAPVPALLPAAILEKHWRPEPAPPELAMIRFLALNVVLLGAGLAAVAGGVLWLRSRHS